MKEITKISHVFKGDDGKLRKERMLFIDGKLV